MAKVTPFRALRPTPEAAARVAAVPYDVVSTDEARALAAGNPLSFLHVSRAEIDLPPGTDPYSDAVYRQAAANFERLKASAPLVIEAAPSLYVYRLRMGTHVQDGVAGGFSLDEYDRGVIRKHEFTRADKEDDRTRHLREIGAQTGPVFLTYRASPVIDAIVRQVTAEPPLFDFVAPDGVQHVLWRVDAGSLTQLVDAFTVVPALYIADGHHRAASAARARGTDQFLAVAFPDREVQILPYNRVVADLGSHTAASLLSAIRGKFRVDDGAGAPARAGEVGMFLDGRWYTIRLGSPDRGASVTESLDVSRLQADVLAAILGIGDIRSDKRIDFVGGARGTGELEARVRDGRAAVAFAMYPVSVADLMAVCDAGGIMPPKSTWFEPKLRDGLLSHVI